VSLQSWRESPVSHGYHFVMIATDGFGTGIDAPDVRHVVVVGCSRSLIDMWQIVGRIGRDGLIGRAAIPYHSSHAKCVSVEDVEGRLLLEDFRLKMETNVVLRR